MQGDTSNGKHLVATPNSLGNSQMDYERFQRRLRPALRAKTHNQ